MGAYGRGMSAYGLGLRHDQGHRGVRLARSGAPQAPCGAPHLSDRPSRRRSRRTWRWSATRVEEPASGTGRVGRALDPQQGAVADDGVGDGSRWDFGRATGWRPSGSRRRAGSLSRAVVPSSPAISFGVHRQGGHGDLEAGRTAGRRRRQVRQRKRPLAARGVRRGGTGRVGTEPSLALVHVEGELAAARPVRQREPRRRSAPGPRPGAPGVPSPVRRTMRSTPSSWTYAHTSCTPRSNGRPPASRSGSRRSRPDATSRDTPLGRRARAAPPGRPRGTTSPRGPGP